jgi:riboflavin biosynthesis pyrimidine reductase
MKSSHITSGIRLSSLSYYNVYTLPPTTGEQPVSVLDQIKKLDAEKARLLSAAKEEALQKAEEAVATLNELGFKYRLVEGGRKAAATGKRRTGIRDEVLATIKAHPDGMKRADILTAMNAEEKSAQQSISNALAALKKSGTVTAARGVYKAV